MPASIFNVAYLFAWTLRITRYFQLVHRPLSFFGCVCVCVGVCPLLGVFWLSHLPPSLILLSIQYCNHYRIAFTILLIYKAGRESVETKLRLDQQIDHHEYLYNIATVSSQRSAWVAIHLSERYLYMCLCELFI